MVFKLVNFLRGYLLRKVTFRGYYWQFRTQAKETKSLQTYDFFILGIKKLQGWQTKVETSKVVLLNILRNIYFLQSVKKYYLKHGQQFSKTVTPVFKLPIINFKILNFAKKHQNKFQAFSILHFFLVNQLLSPRINLEHL